MNLFRAFIAGIVFPTIVLPVILLVAVYYGKSALLDQPIIHFVPLIWGIWNLLYFAIWWRILPGNAYVRFILAGAILGFLLAVFAVFVTNIPEILGFGAYRYYPLIAAPIGYAIIWAVVVKPLNKLLNVRE